MTRVTQSLMNRKSPIVSPDLKTSNYVENVGVLPDVPVEYMTRENLMTGGAPYLAEVTRIAVQHVNRNR
ncbi:MAG: hypothetical protein FJW31_02010 [Acidobacteria bacterium]|nr:hypothetical protein [Acidobacteriota bacterium]